VNTACERLTVLWKDDSGATAIEYALIASILGIALLPVLTNTSSGVASLYTRVHGYFATVNGP
jgi:Flp pilus assembly pilin Flp